MKRFLSIVFTISAFVFIQHVFAASAEAATLKFNPTSSSTTGDNITVEIKVDSGTDQISATDAIVTYDPTMVEAVSVSAGTHFPVVTNTITSGKVSITGVVESSSQYKVGEGTIASITFKPLKTGTATVQFYCDTTKSDTSKITKNDINLTNLIICSSNGTHTMTISSTTSGTGGTGSSGSGATSLPNTGGGSSSGGTSLGDGSAGSSQLPQSGVAENIAKYSIPGLALLMLGIAARLMLKI